MPYEFGDVVLVPFPFTNQTAAKRRRAAVVSNRAYNGSKPDIAIPRQLRLSKRRCWGSIRLTGRDCNRTRIASKSAGCLPSTASVRIAARRSITRVTTVSIRSERLKAAIAGEVSCGPAASSAVKTCSRASRDSSYRLNFSIFRSHGELSRGGGHCKTLPSATSSNDLRASPKHCSRPPADSTVPHAATRPGAVAANSMTPQCHSLARRLHL